MKFKYEGRNLNMMEGINEYKIVRSLLACLALLFFTRCDFIYKSDKNNSLETEVDTESIQISKDEATLLVSASQNNLDVLELLDVIKEVEVDSSIKNIVMHIEDNQEAIFKQYGKVAKEHVISIPDYPLVDKKDFLKNGEVPIEAIISKIHSKLNKQKEVMDTLAKTSASKDFKTLAEVANQKLAASLDKTHLLKDKV